ncbi:Piwi-domain-containing protein [Sistotremastrum niveocremeum HHB9708]|uniref:Piwi-domain-containing protein n=2 Tax=Sistotremastraceae TaxID=3402574 RepID=A0A164YKJ2_9AGAM|nr:Piwi-domain-containing protein [Sistotremastrum niveocremeum HHB9708]KZT43424.1 Piwi-domain-containing protein [Sistotremastrum suecicum HHB10207 ss-3]
MTVPSVLTFRKNPHTRNAIFIGTETKVLRNGLIAWKGYHQSIRPSINRLYVNMDTTAAAMYQDGRLIDLCLSFLGKQDISYLSCAYMETDRRSFSRLDRFLRKLRVTIKVGNRAESRPRQITELVPKGTRYKFESGGVETTVERHYRDHHNIALQYPTLVAVGIGDTEVFPIEFLRVVTGQIFRGQIPPESTTEMLQFSKAKPDMRLRQIMDGGHLLDHENSPVMRSSGIRISRTPAEVRGRVLDPPIVRFQETSQIVNKGTFNMVGRKLASPAVIKAWAVVVFDTTNVQVVADWVGYLRQNCIDLGIRILVDQPPIFPHNPSANIEQILLDAANRAVADARRKAEELGLSRNIVPRPDLIIVILPPAVEDLKNRIKHWGDSGAGVSTQCLIGDKCRRLTPRNRDQYYKNVVLKINAKLGGTNFHLTGDHNAPDAIRWVYERPSMIVGADVSHPGPGQTLPSFSAVVSSVDPKAARYVAANRVQEARVERINSLRLFWQTRNDERVTWSLTPRDCWPERILFMRDGLSEGEFTEVKDDELAALREGIRSFFAELRRVKPDFALPAVDPPVKISYLVVIKRHHVRFFPRSQTLTDDSGNVHPGFVMDHTITNPKHRTFFLQSQAGLLGTSRPALYTLLHDENGFTPDSLQELCNGLCYHHARSTRAVSIPAPIYSAHIVSRRGKIHMPQDHDGASTATGDVDWEYWRDNFKKTADTQERLQYWL